MGGHVHTVTVDENGRAIPIDTGFMVYNEVTYPRLTRLFKEIGVETMPTSMSFSVQHLPTDLEYCGTNLNLLFGQRRNLWNFRFIRMLWNIHRFNREALSVLADPAYESRTLKEFVDEKAYGEDFLNLYLLPMSSAVWSTPPGRMLEFPATTLLRFFHNHGFLGLHTQHPWRTVRKGAAAYVDKLIAPFKDKIRRRRRVDKIVRQDGGVSVKTESGETERFDKVVLACHADQALKLLAEPTDMERRLLGQFQYQKNHAVLHTDTRVMPRTRRCWSSWNYRIETDASGETRPSTHYWMNRLQGVSDRRNYFVSINDSGRVDPAAVLKTIEFEHPVYSLGAVRAQKDLPTLNGMAQNQTTYFCGSYFKYGFHEDAFASALDLCRTMLRENLWA